MCTACYVWDSLHLCMGIMCLNIPGTPPPYGYGDGGHGHGSPPPSYSPRPYGHSPPPYYGEPFSMLPEQDTPWTVTISG